MVDVNKSSLESDIDVGIITPAESATVWHSGNVPSFGVAGDFSALLRVNPSLSGSDINADILSQEIRDRAKEATRVRRAAVSKSGTGSNPGAFGCSFGSNGTQVSALNSGYEQGGNVDSKANIQANHDINANTDVDTSDIDDAIAAQASLLVTQRSASAVSLVSCHCSCHNNCHGNRCRR